MDITKIQQTIEKHKPLLEEGKYYEFSQKIKSLSLRQQQMKKTQEALQLLVEGSKNLLNHKDTQESYDLIQNIFELLKENRQYANEEMKSHLLSIYSMFPQNQQKINIANILLKDLFVGDLEICKVVGIDLFNNGLYHLAQKYIIFLDDADFSVNLLTKWIQKIPNGEHQNSVEVEFLVCRYILLKLANKKVEEAFKIYLKFEKDTPLYNFTQFLIRACKLRSRKAYIKISNKYEEILKKDETFSKILSKISSIYFGFQDQESNGLNSMFSGLFN